MAKTSALAKVFAAEVLNGSITFDEVPKILKPQVREILGLDE